MSQCFPQLVAGPIVRYGSIAEQIRSRSHSVGIFTYGLARFNFGFAKKILLANPAGEIADLCFGALVKAHSRLPVAWIGVSAYAFQIYFDFSAYSDMAIGLGRMFGFRFPENFNFPYKSRSITEFWRRWHISLSSFLRDYLYIPLGGNRKGTDPHLHQPDAGDAHRRPVARCTMDIYRMGSHTRRHARTWERFTSRKVPMDMDSRSSEGCRHICHCPAGNLGVFPCRKLRGRRELSRLHVLALGTMLPLQAYCWHRSPARPH